MTGGWCYGGFKATPASGGCLAHTIAHDAPHALNAAFTLERFAEGRMIDEKGAGLRVGALMRLTLTTCAGGQSASGAAAMLLIPCPWCGPRSQIEFTYGGDATVAPARRPTRRKRTGSLRLHPRQSDGPARRAGGLHSAGCRQWFKVRRDTRTHEILGSAAPGAALPRWLTDDAVLPPGERRNRRPVAAAALRRSTARPTKATPATRSLPRFSPTACISSAAASSITGRAASSSAGVEEPNALVQLGARRAHRAQCPRDHAGALSTGSSQRARTAGRRFASTSARSTTLASRLIPAGFYYKTFMWPPTPKWWLRYEHLIRHAAGMGRAASAPDPDRVRAPVRPLRRPRGRRGPRGPCRGSLGGARRRARAVVRRERRRSAAAFSARRRRSTDATAPHGRRPTSRSLRRAPTSRSCRARRHSAATTATWSDWSSVSPTIFRRPGVRRRASACGKCAPGRSCSRPARTSAASPIANNDLPGTYARRRRAHLRRALRGPARIARRRVHQQRQRVRDGTCAAARGRRSRRDRRSAFGCGTRRRVADRGARSGPAHRRQGARSSAHTARCACARSTSCRCPAARRARRLRSRRVSGGWNPAVHLHSQARGRLRYDDDARDVRSRRLAAPIAPAGAANGRVDLAAALAEGHAVGIAAAARAGLSRRCLARTPPHAAAVASGARREPLWSVRAPQKSAKALRRPAERRHRRRRRARRARRLSVGRASQALHDARHGHRSGQARQRRRHRAAGGGTRADRSRRSARRRSGRRTRRSTLGAFPGTDSRARTSSRRAIRAMHDWHVAHGARFVNAGLWKRPHSYPRAGESADDAASREASNVRANVGVVDVSTLGKIELQGRDVAELPESRLHQPLGHARRRPLPLRRDAARRRHGPRRRDDVAARADRTT